MSTEPLVKPLSLTRRVWLFRFLVLLFVCTVPVFIFYAVGYRVTFFGEDRAIITVGGMFISSEEENTEIYINESLVQDYRLFQRAAYIQNLPAGTHRVHVQGKGLHTWVKELSVYPHIVTEASAFTLPVVPQLRMITEYQTSTGTAMLRAATSTVPASTSVMYRNPWLASSTVATSSLVANTEYTYLNGQFGTSTINETSVFSRITSELENFTFSSSEATTSTTTSTTTATTTKSSRDRVLYESEGDIYFGWQGSQGNVPYYFCFQYMSATSTLSNYTDHAAADLAAVYASIDESVNVGSLVCRDRIKIDTQGHEIYDFDFYPQNPDLVLLTTNAGLFVVEADDRSWQNAQQIYPAGQYEVLVDGTQIFLRTGRVIFELIMEVEQSL